MRESGKACATAVADVVWSSSRTKTLPKSISPTLAAACSTAQPAAATTTKIAPIASPTACGGLPAFRIDQLHRHRRGLVVGEHDLQAAVAQFLIHLIRQRPREPVAGKRTRDRDVAAVDGEGHARLRRYGRCAAEAPRRPAAA